MIAFFVSAFVLATSPAQLQALSNQAIESRDSNSLVVWNVGQGQWVTALANNRCLHFDTGGEFVPWRLLERACAERENAAYFSHWDWDHVSFVRDLQRRARYLCVAAHPGGTAKPKRARMLEGIDECSMGFEGVAELKRSSHREDAPTNRPRAVADSTIAASTLAKRKSRAKESSNSASRIFIIDKFLIPGDSTTREEAEWKSDARIQEVKVLILGHHGSNTSTSSALLAKLINVRQAVASARHEKYGHPHPLVEMRLRMHGIALLRTEDWGSIIFERSSEPHLVRNAKPLKSNLHSLP